MRNRLSLFFENQHLINYFAKLFLPCSLHSHRNANPRPKNELRHFSAMPTHHPSVVAKNEMRANTTKTKLKVQRNLTNYDVFWILKNQNTKENL